ncbi:Thiamine-monophosphate kinase [bacterium HR36]|nr:Thiamine-monophosphate kinase [bacterium HR36]
MMSELDLINWLRKRLGGVNEQILVGLGDDAAVIKWASDRKLVITTDMMLEGTCFLAEHGMRRIGRKALAINLSDLAAMAAEPIAAVVSLALPRSLDLPAVQELYEGMLALAEEFAMAIIGGDTNSWSGPLAINVAAIGRAGPYPVVRRKGAQPGDWLFVTGPLGGSILGKHLDFIPRVREALRLSHIVSLRAMIDISDGLARDLHHLCQESGCGAIIEEEHIPISSAAYALRDGVSPLEHALSDGEDFELLFAVAPEEGKRLLQTQPLQDLDVILYPIGECIPEGIYIRYRDGHLAHLPPLGYTHRFGN